MMWSWTPKKTMGACRVTCEAGIQWAGLLLYYKQVLCLVERALAQSENGVVSQLCAMELVNGM